MVSSDEETGSLKEAALLIVVKQVAVFADHGAL